VKSGGAEHDYAVTSIGRYVDLPPGRRELTLRDSIGRTSHPQMEHLLKGLAIGFALAAPVGPINLLCLRRSLMEGRRVGFVSGLGAAAADSTYGALAAIGVNAVTGFLIGHSVWLHLFGGLFLVILGLGTMRARSSRRRGGGTTASWPPA